VVGVCLIQYFSSGYTGPLMLEKRWEIHHFSQGKAVDKLHIMVSDQLRGQLRGKKRVCGLSPYASVKYLHCCAIELLDLLGVGILQELIQVVFG